MIIIIIIIMMMMMMVVAVDIQESLEATGLTAAMQHEIARGQIPQERWGGMT